MPTHKPPRCVWILGAGFSRPLGGPLFADLLGSATAGWVHGWLRSLEVHVDQIPNGCVKLYDLGIDRGLWSNAEECLALVNQAAIDKATRNVVESGLASPDGPPRLELERTKLTHFIGAAVSHFVDRVSGSQSLPDAWTPFVEWARLLTERDTIVTFNYDLVVETLRQRAGTEFEILKLHGSVPPTAELKACIERGDTVAGIYAPGPSKLSAVTGPLTEAWNKAEQAIRESQRLVVIGYSFPSSDAYARWFLLKHATATHVTVVLGKDPVGEEVANMFRRAGKEAMNTGLFSQDFLAEGTAADGKEFDHHRFLRSHAEQFMKAMSRVSD